MSPSVIVCPSNEWIFSSSSAARLQLTVQVPPGFGQEIKYSTSVTDHSCCSVTGHCSFKARSAHRRNVTGVSSPDSVKHSLCLANDLCTESTARSTAQCVRHLVTSVVLPIWSTQKVGLPHIAWKTQRKPRSHHIKHILHALMPPTFSVPLHKSTSLWRQTFLLKPSFFLS